MRRDGNVWKRLSRIEEDLSYRGPIPQKIEHLDHTVFSYFGEISVQNRKMDQKIESQKALIKSFSATVKHLEWRIRSLEARLDTNNAV